MIKGLCTLSILCFILSCVYATSIPSNLVLEIDFSAQTGQPTTFACQIQNGQMNVTSWNNYSFYGNPTTVTCVQTLIGCGSQDGNTTVYWFTLVWNTSSLALTWNIYEEDEICTSNVQTINYNSVYWSHCRTPACFNIRVVQWRNSNMRTLFICEPQLTNKTTIHQYFII